MENLDTGTIIAVMAFITGLGFIFNILLSPVKKDMARLEIDIKSLKDGQAKLEAGQAELKELILKQKS